MPAGRLPRHKEVVLTNDLIDCARPGEEVDVTGGRGAQDWCAVVILFCQSVLLHMFLGMHHHFLTGVCRALKG